MSMISAQIDELRELAGDGSMEWVTGPIRASVLRDAADTIWQLRDDLQRTHGLLGEADREESRAWDRVRKAEAEADRLREERDMYRDLVGMMDHPDLNAQLNAENAKLRELVLCLLTCSSDTGDACDRCPVNGGAGIWDFEDFCDSLLDRVHELRIELNA